MQFTEHTQAPVSHIPNLHLSQNLCKTPSLLWFATKKAGGITGIGCLRQIMTIIRVLLFNNTCYFLSMGMVFVPIVYKVIYHRIFWDSIGSLYISTICHDKWL